jgi:hypothetical protein
MRAISHQPVAAGQAHAAQSAEKLASARRTIFFDIRRVGSVIRRQNALCMNA